MQNHIYIVGAHSRAQTLGVYLQYLHPEIRIEAYLYDNEEKNPLQVEETPVLRMDSCNTLHTDYPVYIGTRGIYHPHIRKHLEEIGFQTIIPVTVELDLKLRNEYLEKYFSSTGREFEKIDRLSVCPGNSAAVYVVRSVFDKPLQEEYFLADYEREILAGAVFAKEYPFSGILRDDAGDNISDRNKQFCELTALYWIWKHAKENLVGLVHYRRHFMIPDNWTSRMLHNGIDVILPIPLYVAPNVAENFKKRHDPSDWDYMMQCLRKDDEQTYQEAETFFQSSLYSPCNMFIMQREVLHELCSWMFPILFKVAEHGGQKEDSYLNRYPGFLSERLITFFFEKNREKYKTVYADKNFLP